jgi:hypothetical protein
LKQPSARSPRKERVTICLQGRVTASPTFTPKPGLLLVTAAMSFGSSGQVVPMQQLVAPESQRSRATAVVHAETSAR